MVHHCSNTTAKTTNLLPHYDIVDEDDDVLYPFHKVQPLIIPTIHFLCTSIQ